MAECLTKKRNYCVNKIYSQPVITTTSDVICLLSARDYHFIPNPVEYTDPDGKYTMPIPWGFQSPNVLPKSFPFLDILRLPFAGTVTPYVFPMPNTLPKVDGIDWYDPPNTPDGLGSEWEELPRDPRAPEGNREFKNSKTGRTIRWDKGDGRNQGPHWHRDNPDPKTNKQYPKLDRDGNPVKDGSGKSHIYPKTNPKYKPGPSPVPAVPKEPMA